MTMILTFVGNTLVLAVFFYALFHVDVEDSSERTVMLVGGSVLSLLIAANAYFAGWHILELVK